MVKDDGFGDGWWTVIPPSSLSRNYYVVRVRFDRVSFCELYDVGRAGGAVKIILLLHKMGQIMYQVQKGSST